MPQPSRRDDKGSVRKSRSKDLESSPITKSPSGPFTKEEQVLLSSLSFGRRFAAVSLLSALAAGCSASGSTPSSAGASARTLSQGLMLDSTPARTASQSRGWLSPDAKRKKGKDLIYWGNFDNNTITIYSSKGVNGKEKGQITTGLSEPERLFVDKQLNVYATNPGNNTITAYKPGQTSPSLTI